MYSMRSFFWRTFLRYPIVAGHATYGMGIIHIALVGIAVCATGTWIMRRFRFSPAVDQPLLLYLAAAGVIMGTLMTLSTLKIHPHYLIVLSPFVHLWVAAVYCADARYTGVWSPCCLQHGGIPHDVPWRHTHARR